MTSNILKGGIYAVTSFLFLFWGFERISSFTRTDARYSTDYQVTFMLPPDQYSVLFKLDKKLI